MHKSSNNPVAVLPFVRNGEAAHIVTDGKAVRSYRQDRCDAHDSLWWAVEILSQDGFLFCYNQMQSFADEAFQVIAAPRGWNVVHLGVHWYGRVGTVAKVFGTTKYHCQVECIRECLKYCD